jgi:hypothetical protein
MVLKTSLIGTRHSKILHASMPRRYIAIANRNGRRVSSARKLPERLRLRQGKYLHNCRRVICLRKCGTMDGGENL